MFILRVLIFAQGDIFVIFLALNFAQEPVFMSISLETRSFLPLFELLTSTCMKPHYRTIFEEISNHLRAVPIWANFWYLFSDI